MRMKVCFFGLVLITCSIGCQAITKSMSSATSSATKTVINATNSTPMGKIVGSEPKVAAGRPDSIVAIWKDATYTVANQTPTRGFGGRIYFYDRDKNPIAVDGELVVYGFVDEKDKRNDKPEKRFITAREELPNHMSISSAGPSYTVWLPWDHIAGKQLNVTIVAAFKDASGKNIRGEAIAAVLPGEKSAMEQEAEELIESIQAKAAIKYRVDRKESLPSGSEQLTVQSIAIPDASKERLFGSVPVKQHKLPEPKITHRRETSQSR